MQKLNLPKFDLPPVIETVLSAQFSPLQNFTDAHVGWFWKNYLDPDWDKIQVAQSISDQYEEFGENKTWNLERQLAIKTQVELSRTQIIKSANERMIQVQNTRFIYNWRKKEKTVDDYPSYDKLVPEFDNNFSKFRQFAKDLEGTDLKLNQWEVTYVNHLLKGDVWETTEDWLDIFPNMSSMATDVPGQTFDNFRGVWSLAIDETKGRLHIEMKHVRIGDISGPEVLLLQFTARGPVSDEVDLNAGFKLGHESIVRTFTNMTSPKCHEIWKRTQ